MPLDPVPVLDIATNPRRSSRVVLGSSTDATVRVRLSADLVGASPRVRSWSMAHELSHVQRRQQGVRPVGLAPPLTAAAVSASAGVGGLAGAGWALAAGPPWAGPASCVVAVAGVLGLWLVLLALHRQEEAATDTTACTVFGQVLTEAGVARLAHQEGPLARWVPTLLRSHPRPSRRRRREPPGDAAV